MGTQKRQIFIAVSLICVFLCPFFYACSSDYYDGTIYGTYLELHLHGRGSRRASADIAEELERLDGIFSLTVSDSELQRLNNAPVDVSFSVSEDMMSVLSTARAVYDYTEGAFNPALLPVTELWGFAATSSTRRLPSATEISGVIDNCRFDRLSLDEGNLTVTKQSPLRIDLGGIAKGYAVSRACDIAKAYGLEGIINLGGNVYTLGESKIAVTSPRDTAAYNGTLSLSNTSISTSGDYERFFFEGDTRYCHILGRDGQSVRNGIQSVTVIGSDATLCDALSTAIFVAGQDSVVAIAEHFGVGVIILTANTVTTAGTVQNTDYSITDSSYAFAE